MCTTLNSSGENQRWPPSLHPFLPVLLLKVLGEEQTWTGGLRVQPDFTSGCSCRGRYQRGKEEAGRWEEEMLMISAKTLWFGMFPARTLIRSCAFSYWNCCFLSIVSFEAFAESADLGQARGEAINKSVHEGAVFWSSVSVTAPFLGWKRSEQHQIGCDGIVDMVLQSLWGILVLQCRSHS